MCIKSSILIGLYLVAATTTDGQTPNDPSILPAPPPQKAPSPRPPAQPERPLPPPQREQPTPPPVSHHLKPAPMPAPAPLMAVD